MVAPSLVSLAQQVAIKHVDQITSFSDIQFELVRPILANVTSPDQLKAIEEESPQVVGPFTASLWKKFIARDISNGDRNQLQPRNPASWWKVYRKLKREDDEHKAQAEARLKAALQQHKVERESKSSTFLPVVLPGRKEPTKNDRRPDRFMSGPREPWEEDDMEERKAARKEARAQPPKPIVPKAVSSFRKATRGARRNVPFTQAAVSRTAFQGAVSQAPPSMVNQYLRGTGAPLLPASPHPMVVQRKSIGPRTFIAPTTAKGAGQSVREERALNMALARQRAKTATSPTAPQRPRPTSSSAAPQQRPITPSTASARSPPIVAATAPPPPARTSIPTATSTTTSTPSHHESSLPAASAAVNTVQLKRKPAGEVNIFMKPNKRTRR